LPALVTKQIGRVYWSKNASVVVVVNDENNRRHGYYNHYIDLFALFKRLFFSKNGDPHFLN
jgi:hypothetical protein